MGMKVEGSGHACWVFEKKFRWVHVPIRFSRSVYSAIAIQALRYAPMDAEDNGKNLVALLYVNRASSMHKLSNIQSSDIFYRIYYDEGNVKFDWKFGFMKKSAPAFNLSSTHLLVCQNAGLLDESLRDCDRAIAIMPAYVKAWFRRGKVNTLLRNYETAIHDFEVALSMESSPSGMGHINKELEMISSHFNCANRFDSSCRASKWKKLDSSDEPLLAVLQCVSTPSKGRGMTSVDDIAPASLIHSEEPLAASIAEHKHECGGSPWSVVLPTDVVLAGRILAKLMEKRRLSGETSKPVELGLAHNYLQIPPKTKLEVHVYAVVLSCCLKHHYGSDYPITGASVSQVHRQDISKVANWFLEGPGTVRHINQGCCLNCGTDLDIESASIDSKSAMAEIQRLEGCLNSNEDPHTLIPDALKSLTRLRLVRHQYSKVVAQAEDIFAEAFVQFGEFEPALQHCQSSIEILKKLFDSSSIVIGNELIKLASIQLSLGDRSAALHTIKRIEEIFSLYYGSHLVDVCPYVVSLREVIGLD
ncbi:hypothetical protein J5N97_023133 [Dioscorea zingiberensis]|uniref:Uncharacterized protein n=1 Tax=Dioscorea zingiberensis TaxID=325984 RepID=A0A9D5CBV5_9LILI|nr:hypothetical protein J5N97_023133 [Dioscorea zingiberensis]